MTYSDLAKNEGKGIDAIRIRFSQAKRKYPEVFAGEIFARDAEIRHEILPYLVRAKSEKIKTPAQAKNYAITPVTKKEPAKSITTATKNERMIFAFSLGVTGASIWLVTLGMWYAAGLYGATLAFAFAAYMSASVIVARDKNKGDTSHDAVSTVLSMELGAALLHFYTFTKVLNVEPWEVKYAAAALFAMFVAYASYKSIILIRNYNAE